MGDFERQFPISTDTANIKVAAEEWDIMEALVAAMATKGKVTESFKIDRKKVWDESRRKELIAVLGEGGEAKVEAFLKQTVDGTATRHSFMVMVDKDKYPPNGYKIYAMARGKLEGIKGTGSTKSTKAVVGRDNTRALVAILDTKIDIKEEIQLLTKREEFFGQIERPMKEPEKSLISNYFLDYLQSTGRGKPATTPWVGKESIGGKRYVLQQIHEGYNLSDYAFDNQTTLAKDFSLRLKIAQQICIQLKNCHDKNQIHRDIKPENIIWDPKNQTAALIDFGFAATMQDSTGTITGRTVGTPGFVPPEACKHPGAPGLSYTGTYSKASDIYSCGVTLLLLGFIPVGDYYYNQVLKIADESWKLIKSQNTIQSTSLLLSALINEWCNAYPAEKNEQEIARLIVTMLSEKAADRPALENVLNAINAAIAAVEKADAEAKTAAAPVAPGPLRFSSGAKPVSTNSLASFASSGALKYPPPPIGANPELDLPGMEEEEPNRASPASFASSAVEVSGVQSNAGRYSQSPKRRDGSMDELDPPPKLT